ncbi:hypothetical protein [Lutimaribacter saemankumensis]|uniref:Uncharacterized protein n=1 Tax=Lutimaribacter saemankumensis TaxID=490829 RepID=A0A1G8M1F2_9RHOB|nr:hypothetical protein [Lutimaribacter saemankumensis]SDI61766.1 hypothetical protein SAMN05421850_10412 [Lutimaribacter saemankumensis]
MSEITDEAPIPEDLVGTRQGIFFLLQAGADPAPHDAADVPAFARRIDETAKPLKLTQAKAVPQSRPRTFHDPDATPPKKAAVSDYLSMDDFHFNL